MSDYKIVNGKKVRACKYTCGQMLAYDEENKFFIEVDHTNERHTPERCKAFKEIKQDPKKEKAVETLKDIANVTNNQKQEKFNHTDVVTLEQVLKKLKLVGVDIDLELLLKNDKGSDYIR